MEKRAFAVKAPEQRPPHSPGHSAEPGAAHGRRNGRETSSTFRGHDAGRGLRRHHVGVRGVRDRTGFPIGATESRTRRYRSGRVEIGIVESTGETVADDIRATMREMERGRDDPATEFPRNWPW